MKMDRTRVLSVVALASLVALIGCKQNSESKPAPSEGVAERTGAALDTAAEKTRDAAKATAAATREMTDKAVEKTGEALEKAGDAVQNTGAKMRDLEEGAATGE